MFSEKVTANVPQRFPKSSQIGPKSSQDLDSRGFGQKLEENLWKIALFLFGVLRWSHLDFEGSAMAGARNDISLAACSVRRFLYYLATLG